MKIIELTNGKVTIIEGKKEIENYGRNVLVPTEKDFVNKDCIVALIFENKLGKKQPIFIYPDCVKPIYAYTHFTTYKHHDGFIELIDEFFKKNLDLYRPLTWKYCYEKVSKEHTFFNEENKMLTFKNPVIMCDYPDVCIAMDSIDGTKKYIVCEVTDDGVMVCNNYGYGETEKLRSYVFA